MRSEITGEKIILRKYETDFIPLLFEAAIESRGGEFTRWMPWCHENYKIEESEEFVRKSVENWENKTEYNFGVFDAETGEFAGGIGLNLYNDVRRLMNLGYWVRTGFWGRGIAPVAARILAKAAFEDLDLVRIEIAAAIENYASQKVAEKAGATREGVLRQLLNIGGKPHDAAMFSFIREDFFE